MFPRRDSCTVSCANADCSDVMATHDGVIKWTRFLRSWPFVRGIHRSPVNSPQQRPVTRSFDVFFDLHQNKRLSKQSRRRRLETPRRSLWRHCNFTRRITATWGFHHIWFVMKKSSNENRVQATYISDSLSNIQCSGTETNGFKFSFYHDY